MIPYFNFLNADRNLLGTIEQFSAVWNTEYYGTGDFEIIVPAISKYVSLINQSEYISRPDDENIGVIEHIDTNRAKDENKTTVRGRFIKALLDQRIIANPYLADAVSQKRKDSVITYSGRVERAIYRLVSEHIGPNAYEPRKISFVRISSESGLTRSFSAPRQVHGNNLLDYTDETLQEFKYGAKMTMDTDKNFVYKIYEGADRTYENDSGNSPVIFAAKFDNLTDTEKTFDRTPLKNVALIGGSGEGAERFYAQLHWEGEASTYRGINRREVFIDARDQSKTYIQNDTTLEYSDTDYCSMLVQHGTKKMSEYTVKDDFTGTINLAKSPFQYKTDFNIGDMVTVIDDDGEVRDARIISVTEAQDDKSGYMVIPKFE